MEAKRLIDANDALERLKKAKENMKVVSIVGIKAVDISSVLNFIETRPTVDAVEVVHGRWEKIAYHPYYCSNCGNIEPLDFEGESHYRSNYCPNCGAKMDGDGNA